MRKENLKKCYLNIFRMQDNMGHNAIFIKNIYHSDLSGCKTEWNVESGVALTDR